MREADHIHFIKDLEVRDLDTLDHASLAHALHQGVHLANLPFRVALFGPWGSGKTTIMRRVQALLDKATTEGRAPHFGPGEHGNGADGEPYVPYVRTLYFNPWEYESGTSLVATFVRSMSALVPDEVRYSRKGTRVIRQALESVRHVGTRLGAPVPNTSGEVPTVDELTEPDQLVALRESLRRLVDLTLSAAEDEQPRRLVVFVDDLDKCLPESVLTFLEGCKLFFTDDTRVVFVFALDRQVVSNAIGVKYSRTAGFDPERYLEKIFEFSYTVHPIQWQQLGTLVADLYTRSGLGDVLDGDARNGEMEAIQGVLSRPGVVSNPRRIKRTFNKFIWFLAARDWLPNCEDGEVEPWLVWLLVSEYWREFRDDFVAPHGEEVLGELFNRVTGNLLFPHSNEIVRSQLETLPGYRSLVEYFRSMLNGIGDYHAEETQSHLRGLIARFLTIDKTLRAHGL